LNEAVKRNEDRFPSDFMFQLTKLAHCDIKFEVGRQKACALCLYRAGCGHALQRVAQPLRKEVLRDAIAL
jgi:hypothetical protein